MQLQKQMPAAIDSINTAANALKKLSHIETEKEKKQATEEAKTGKAIIKEIAAARLKITREIDKQKKAIMAEEKEIIAPLEAEISRITNLVAAYNNALEMKRREEERKIRKAQALNEKQEKSFVSFLEMVGRAVLAEKTEALAASTSKLEGYKPKEEAFGKYHQEVVLLSKQGISLLASKKEAVESGNAEQVKACNRIAHEKFLQKAGIQVDEMVSEATNAEIKVQATTQKFSTSNVRKVWDFEIENPSAVPAEFMQVNEKAVREAVRKGVREIPGIKIFQKTVTVI